MSTAILIHGWAQKEEAYNPKYPSPSNSHWLPWLTKQLMIKDIHTIAVEMPKAYYPVYPDWKREFERFDVNEETILVGHSCGAGFLVRWLSENQQRVGKVILVAPWTGIRPDQPFDDSFFQFKADQHLVDRTQGVTIYLSTDDGSMIKDSVTKLREEVEGMKYREFEGKGHFTLHSMGTEAFPELLEDILV